MVEGPCPSLNPIPQASTCREPQCGATKNPADAGFFVWSESNGSLEGQEDRVATRHLDFPVELGAGGDEAQVRGHIVRARVHLGAHLVEDAEVGLYAALMALPEPDTQLQSRGDMLAIMQSLGGLRQPIDAFFDSVVVNHDDASTRLNRLGLLAMVRQAMRRVADFSRLEG